MATGKDVNSLEFRGDLPSQKKMKGKEGIHRWSTIQDKTQNKTKQKTKREEKKRETKKINKVHSMLAF